MVDIKREDITLSDWTKGISADEFAWGSYFYSDGIQTWYSTKGFKLWPKVDVENLNERTTGWPLAIYPSNWSLLSSTKNFIAFTSDWFLEMWGSLNGSTYWEWGEAWGWAIYQEYNPALTWTWGYVYGDYALIFRGTGVEKVDYKNTYNIEYGQTIANPRFENNASGWTVGTGWTLTDDWMEHETGETWTLEVSADWYANGRWRFAVKITNCTAWTVTYRTSQGWGTDVVTTEAWKNGWFCGIMLNTQENVNYTLTITPSSDFDWIVEAVNFNVYDPDAEDVISGLTNADKHIAIERWWDIFIAWGNTVDILSTVDWTISDSKQLVRDDETIVAMNTQGDSIIIRATNGIDSHQYYWNWVDSIASEVINWQWQVIKAVTGTEIISYVLTVGTNSGRSAFRLYSVSWYQRSLIASNAFKIQSNSRNLEHYHPSKKFAFNDVQWPESMAIYLDNLYLPWCDGIYQFGQTLPWLSNAWSRPIKYENGADKLFLFQTNGSLYFAYRLDYKTYYGVVNSDEYTDKWYLVTDSIYWDKLGTRKALEKLKLGYKSLSSNNGKINIYAIVDDDYFWRFDISWVTNRPKIWDVYTVATGTNAEIISINKTSTTAGEITLRTVKNEGSLSTANRRLNKVTGSGDSQLDSHNNYDNMVLVKTITDDTQEYGADLIFWKDFVNNYIPFRHKIQLVIELVKTNQTNNNYRTPEIYELSMVSDITDITL